jgi:hypothetical protein
MEATAQKSDFGIGNAALISLVALLLFFVAWHQKPLQFGKQSPNSNLTLQPTAQTIAQSNSGNAQVLGASTYNKDFIKQLPNIPLQISSNISASALQNYAFQIYVAVQNDQVSDRSAEHELKFLTDINKLAVPNIQELQDYQKLLIASYQLDYAQSSGQLDNSQSGLIDQVKQQLDLIRADIQNNFQIKLP